MSIAIEDVSIAVFLALAIEFAILYAIKLFIKGKNGKGFWDFAKAPDGYPSLPRFQAVLWSIVVFFAFLSVYFVRLRAGQFEINQRIPTNLLSLIGITMASNVAGSAISQIKSGNPTNPDNPSGPNTDEPQPPWRSMLEEKDKPSTTRFQMFAFTLIGIVIYIVTLLSYLYGPQVITIDVGALGNIAIPEVDTTMLGVMGFSNAGYLFGKWSDLS